MAAERRVVGEHHVVAHHAVVGHVAGHHEQAIVAHPCHAAAGHGAGIHGHVLANGVAGADDQAGRLALVGQVLGRATQACKRMDVAAFADLGSALDVDVGGQAHVVGQAHVRADDAVGADLDTVAQLRLRIDQGGGVDRGHVRGLI